MNRPFPRIGWALPGALILALIPAAFVHPSRIWAIAPAALLCAFAIILDAYACLRARASNALEIGPTLLWLFPVLAGLSAVSIYGHFLPAISIREIVWVCAYAAFFWMGLKLRGQRGFMVLFSILIISAALYQISIGIGQWLSSTQVSIAHRAWDIKGGYAVHTELAGLTALAVPFSIALIAVAPNRAVKVLLIPLPLALLGGLLFIASRGVWAAVILAAGATFLLMPVRRKYLWAAVILVACAACMWLGRDILMSRINLWGAEGSHFLDDPRFKSWSSAWRLMTQAPWTGVGLGFFEYASASVQPIDYPRWQNYTFNSFLLMGSELGFPGLILATLFYVHCAANALRAVRSSGGENGAFRAATGMACLAFLTHSLVDHNFQTLFNASVFLILMGWLQPIPQRTRPMRIGSILRLLNRSILLLIALGLIGLMPIIALSNAYHALAKADLRARKFVSANQNLKNARRIFPYNYHAVRDQAELWGQVASEDKDASRALLLWHSTQKLWQETLRINPSMPEHHIDLGMAAAQANGGRITREILDHFELAIAAREGQARPCYVTGRFVLQRCPNKEQECRDWAVSRLRQASERSELYRDMVLSLKI